MKVFFYISSDTLPSPKFKCILQITYIICTRDKLTCLLVISFYWQDHTVCNPLCSVGRSSPRGLDSCCPGWAWRASTPGRCRAGTPRPRAGGERASGLCTQNPEIDIYNLVINWTCRTFCCDKLICSCSDQTARPISWNVSFVLMHIVRFKKKKLKKVNVVLGTNIMGQTTSNISRKLELELFTMLSFHLKQHLWPLHRAWWWRW